MGETTYLSTPAQGNDRTSGGWGISAFTLKLLAALTMLCDHVGAYLGAYLPFDVTPLRIIGRLAFPIYAYFIAEGCRYTRNKPKRFLLVLGLAVICEAAYLITSGEITGTVLVTFSCSILMIYALQALKAACTGGGKVLLLSVLAFVGSVTLTFLVGYIIPMDYGVPGAFLPVLLSFLDYVPGKTPACFRVLDKRTVRLGVFALGMCMVWWFRRSLSGDLQLYSLVALLPVAFYNGRAGTKKIKYGFYIFYPAHLFAIWLIDLWLSRG